MQILQALKICFQIALESAFFRLDKFSSNIYSDTYICLCIYNCKATSDCCETPSREWHLQLGVAIMQKDNSCQ